MLLNDPDILASMEHDLCGSFIPVTLKKDGISVSKGELRSLEGFGELMSQVTDTLTRIGEKLKAGEASAVPLKTSSIDACEYCQMKVICRRQVK